MRTMATAGRTVLFSSMTVALSMSVMVLFPMYFLKSFAYAGVAVVALAAFAAIVVTPAAIALLGPRLDSLDVHRLVRRLLRRPEPVRRPVERHLLLSVSQIRDAPGDSDPARRCRAADRAGFAVLHGQVGPARRSRVTAHRARRARSVISFAPISLTTSPRTSPLSFPDAADISTAEMDRYATQLSQVHAVSSVSSPDGTFVGGRPRRTTLGADRGQRRQRVLDRHEQRAAVLSGLARRSSTSCRRCPVRQVGTRS